MARRLDKGGLDEGGGALAATGAVDPAVIEAFLGGDAYFFKMPPKSLDRDSFPGGLGEAVAHLSDADAAATLAGCAVAAVARGMEHCPAPPPTRLFVTGGGRHNAVLMAGLAALLDCPPVDPVEAIGLDGDMLEAQAFAYLAVRVARGGLATSCPTTTGGVSAAVGGGGVVSEPVV